MLISRVVVSAFLGGMMVLGACGVSGQNYPNKPIRLITSSVGGTNDLSARLISPEIAARWGQPMVVQNVPTVVSIETVAKAEPDGYTLLIAGSPLWNEPLLKKVSYDPVRDFSPVAFLIKDPFVLVAHSSLPVKSVKELIALAKARPGELDYASGGTGSTGHLGLALFSAMAGIKMVNVNYNGNGPGAVGLASGEVQLMITAPATAGPFVKSGKLKILAVTGARPSPLLPGIPTVTASGVPGFELTSYNALFAPAKTPAAIITRLNQETVRVVEEIKEKFYKAGAEAGTSSPEELAATIKSEMAKWGKVIKDVGIRVE